MGKNGDEKELSNSYAEVRKNGRVFCISGCEAMKLHEGLGEGNPYNRIVADF